MPCESHLFTIPYGSSRRLAVQSILGCPSIEVILYNFDLRAVCSSVVCSSAIKCKNISGKWNNSKYKCTLLQVNVNNSDFSTVIIQIVYRWKYSRLFLFGAFLNKFIIILNFVEPWLKKMDENEKEIKSPIKRLGSTRKLLVFNSEYWK